MAGFLEIQDLEVGKRYTLMDILYKERGFLKMDERRTKHRFAILVADKWGCRPRTFEYAPGVQDLDGDEIVGNVIMTPGHRIITVERHKDNFQDPYITIMEVTDLHTDIEVKVLEKFRPGQLRKYINDHYCAYALKLGLEMIDVDVVSRELRALYRTVEKVSN